MTEREPDFTTSNYLCLGGFSMSLFIAVLLASAQATAAVPPSPAPQTAPAPKAKKICRTDESSGSHMTKRLCLTEQEWAEKDQKNGVATTRYGISGKAQDH